MSLEQKPFTRYNEEKKVDSFSVRLNDEERTILNNCKKLIEQPKDSTALKTLAWLGAKTLHEDKTKYLLETVFKNKRKNYRIGITEFE